MAEPFDVEIIAAGPGGYVGHPGRVINILDALVGEHGLLYAQFDRIVAEAPRIENLSLLRAEADLLITSLQAHLSLEDALLCARMTSYVKQQPPIVGCEISHE